MALGGAQSEKRFFRGPRCLGQLGPLRSAELAPSKTIFDHARQRGVHVVAAQHQMIADGDAAEQGTIGGNADLDEREIGGAAADIDDERQPDIFQGVGEVVSMARSEVVESGLGFLDQRELFQPSLLSGADGQSPGGFVKRGWDSDDDLLSADGRFGMSMVPSGGHLAKQQCGSIDRRDFIDFSERTPRKDGRGTIHTGVAEPAFGRSHQASWHARSLPTGEFANDEVAASSPRKLSRSGRQLVFARNVEARREQGERCHLAGPLQLGNREILDTRPWAVFRPRVCHGAVGRAEVNADDVRRIHLD